MFCTESKSASFTRFTNSSGVTHGIPPGQNTPETFGTPLFVVGTMQTSHSTMIGFPLNMKLQFFRCQFILPLNSKSGRPSGPFSNAC